MHLLNHLRPGRNAHAGDRFKTRAIQTAIADKRVVRLDLNLERINFLHQPQKIIFANRMAGDMPNAAQFGMPTDYFHENFGQRECGETAEDCAAKAPDGAAVVRNKPFEQTTRICQLATDHRGANSQTILIRHFAEQLCPAVQIIRIRRVVFRITSFSAGEYAVRADLN